MNNTANRTRPKVMNAGMAGLIDSFKGEMVTAGRADYGQSAGTFQTFRRRRHARSAWGTRQFRGLSKEVWLLPSGRLLGFDGGDRCHIQDTARGHRGGQ